MVNATPLGNFFLKNSPDAAAVVVTLTSRSRPVVGSAPFTAVESASLGGVGAAGGAGAACWVGRGAAFST